MYTIIAGSRTAIEQNVNDAMAACPWTNEITHVVSGAQKSVDSKTGEIYGADYYGEKWAERNNLPVSKYPAQWKKYGKYAGPMRNDMMAVVSQALVAVWDGESKGTKNMIDTAERRGLRVFVYRFQG